MECFLKKWIYMFDEIVEIVEIGYEDVVDIEVSGNNLFYANDILTHNSGFVSTDIGLENTSESFGLPATADFMVALWSTEELEKLGQIVVKQLKNRYNDVTTYKKFVVGIDRSKMRLFDLDESAQKGLQDSGTGDDKDDDVPAFDKSKFGNGMKAENKVYDKSKFSDVNF